MIETPKERWLLQAWIDEIVAIIKATLGTVAQPAVYQGRSHEVFEH